MMRDTCKGSREAQGRGIQDLLWWLLLVGAHELCSSLGGPRPDPNRMSGIKGGISSIRVSSRARVTALKLPPTHPMLTPLPRMKQKPSPGTQPWQSTKLGGKSRREVGREAGINQHLHKH